MLLTMNKQTRQMNYQALNMPLGNSVLALLEKEFPPDSSGGSDNLHFHNHLEIGYCYYGSGNMTMGSEKIPYGSNIFTVIPQNIPHMTEIGNKIGASWDYLMIDIHQFLSITYKDAPSMADQLIRDVSRQTHLVKAEEHPETAALIRKINNVMREQNEWYLEEARGLILALLIQIARWNRSKTEGGFSHPVEDHTIIFPALDYISKDPSLSFRIEELARMCHISETHFRRVFVEYMKMPPVKYINQLRIRKACYELRRTNDPIDAISIRAGFATPSTFNRNFRQITGITPQQFRKHPELYHPEHEKDSFYK